MPRLVKGNELSPLQKLEVLNHFNYRWTFENGNNNYRGRCPACMQQYEHGGSMVIDGVPWHQFHAPLVTDLEWLNTHYFYIGDNGKLDSHYKYCESINLGLESATC